MQEKIQPILPVIIAGSILMILLAGFIISFFLVHTRRRQFHLMEIKAIKSAYETELLKSQIELQEQTFQNISQEIHDNFGQVLSLVKLNLNTLGDLSVQDATKVKDTKQLVSQVIIDLRNLSRGMNSAILDDLGLPGALEQEVELLKSTNQYDVRFEITGTTYRLDGKKEIITFRTCQEILNNIIKHANATFISIYVLFSADSLELVIEDDGKGFDLTLIPSSSQGIRNIKNRMALIGASLDIRSTLGSGTKIHIQLPNKLSLNK